EENIEELTRKLMRIGLDNIYGYIDDISDLGIELHQQDIIDIEQFEAYIGHPEVQIVDVRGYTEYEKYHVDGADNIFVGTLPDNLDKHDSNKQLVIYCQTGYRATIAHSVLAKHGFENIKIHAAGMKAWMAKKNV